MTSAPRQLTLVAFYIFTRTFGIPLFGPAAGEIEAVQPVDLVAQFAEVACAIALGARLLVDSRFCGRGAPTRP
ncbi:MAG: hypothetical protein ACYDCK_09950 [Thermoplasmatota archaeon]